MGDCAIEITDDAAGSGERTATISGDMTIMNASQVKDALLELFNSSDRLRIDLARVTDMDVTGLQLLCSAHRAAVAAGKCFTVERTGNEVVEGRMAEAGFPRLVGCAEDKNISCIWGGGSNG